MTTVQLVIKYLAMALAIFLVIGIIGGIISAVGLLGGFFGDDAVLEETKVYTLSSHITSLDIKINAADVTIKQADAFSVESNLKNLTVTEKDGTLIVKQKQIFGRANSGAVLKLYIPAETVFEKADITTGAGRLTVDALSADTLSLDLGAGEVHIASLSAFKSADIDGGAGKVTIDDGTLCNLDLDMGVGQLNLTSALRGKSELDLGVGESNITLLGTKQDYAIDVDKGLGSITVDGQNVSDYGNSGNAQNQIDIDGGVGAIHLSFKEK